MPVKWMYPRNPRYPRSTLGSENPKTQSKATLNNSSAIHIIYMLSIQMLAISLTKEVN